MSVSAVSERLVRKGHKVIVFTSTSNLDTDLNVPVNQPIDVEGVEVWYFKRYEPIKKIFPFFPYLSESVGFLYTPDIKQALNKVMPTVDLAHTQQPYIYPTYATAKSAIQNKKPLFYHQRGAFNSKRLDFRGLKKRIYIASIEKPIMHKAITLIALTEEERNDYRRLGVRTYCEIIPNGIDPTFYHAEPEYESLKKFKLSDNQKVILFLGRLHPTKGIDILFKAFLKISSFFPDAVLVLAGPDECNIEEKLKHSAKGSGLENRIIFPGMVEGRDKINLLARADMFCLPSISEGFSTAVLEAMASATPVLLSSGCHFSEVESRQAGWVVEGGIDEWARKLTVLLKESELLKKTGKNARELVRTKYSLDNTVDKLEAVYIEGVNRHNAIIKHKR